MSFYALPPETIDNIFRFYVPENGDTQEWNIFIPDSFIGEIFANFVNTQINLLARLCASSNSELCKFIFPLVVNNPDSHAERVNIFRTIVEKIKSFGCIAENRIYLPHEVAACAQSIDDRALEIFWPTVVEQIQTIDPTIVLNPNQTAAQIRICMAQNEAVLQNLIIPNLTFSGLNLYSLPKEIKYLKGVQNLNLSGNHLQSLPSEIELLTHLDTLDLSNNDFVTFPPSVENMTRLIAIDLELNSLTTLPAGIGRLVNLQVLDLSFNQLESLPPELCSINSLQSLKLNNNNLGSLDDAFGNTRMDNLLVLDLGFNQIDELPDGFGSNFTALQTLHLENNQLTILPISIGSLAQLQNLYLHSNELQTMPATMAHLAALQILNLSNNKLIALPNDDVHNGIVFGNLANLQELSLQSNLLQSVPSWIGHFPALQKLNLNKNVLTTLPNSIGNLNVTELQLMDNKLNVLPAAIGGLNNLVTLKLCRNRLKTLPLEIGDLVNLQMLDISENQIEELPDRIGDLSNLIQLYAHSNNLIKLPKGISQLANVVVFNIENNSILFVPSEILNADNLIIKDNRVLKTYHSELTCQAVSPLGKLYQSVLLQKELGNLQSLFNDLSSQDKQFVCQAFLVCAERASLTDFKWAQERLFDDINVFSFAVKKAISTKLKCDFSKDYDNILSTNQRNLVLVADQMARMK